MNRLFAHIIGLTLVVSLFASADVAVVEEVQIAKQEQSKKSAKPEADSKATSIGRHLPNFIQADSSGKKVALSDFSDAKIMVVVFMGTQCPIGNAYVPDLVKLQDRYKDEQVQVIGVNSNLSDSSDTIAKHVKEFKISFPVLVDFDQVVADLFGAQRTAEVFVLDRKRNIRYRGRFDDRFGYIYKREKSRRQDLEEAVKELIAGKNISVAETEPMGCLITRRDRLKNRGEITFAKHVSRIVQNRCAECHHPGTAAPFSLLTFKDARNWSEMIKEVVVQRRMPPWNADPRYGKFSNDPHLTKEEIDTVVAWIDNGSPLGDKKDLPEPKQYGHGWTFGQPDVVYKMPREYTVPATGTVAYKYFVTPTNFTEDMWVQAAEARPGNRAVVHHIIVFYRDPKSGKTRNLPAIVGTAPGEEPMIWPKGVGLKVPAGSELVWQLHYTPTGKVEKDQSEVGLIFCTEPPQRVAKSKAAINGKFQIPPGADHHRVVSSTRFNQDAELLSLMPHMHLRGKDFLYRAIYPNGKTEIILNVPTYDFNWQHRYRFAKPFPIPSGTKIECIAHFDNSKDNPANPDPKKLVRWGDQTWEEMMIGFISYVDAASPKSQEESTTADGNAGE